MTETDRQELDRELDKVKTEVFLDKKRGDHAAFLAPLMCSLEFEWSQRRGTAWTDGKSLGWNPEFFRAIGRPGRVTVLMHELWHVGYMDPMNCGRRNPRKWNRACDHRINLQLEAEGYDFSTLAAAGFPGLKDPQYKGLSAEEIYELLPDEPEDNTYVVSGDGDVSQVDGDGDLIPVDDPALKAEIVNKVVSAIQQAEMSGAPGAGNMPGSIRQAVERFLKPRLPWHLLLNRFFTALTEEDYTWARPNRRHTEAYLPSREDSAEGLEHLAYYRDISGSITHRQEQRFNSEVKHIKETFRPKLLTLVDFHHEIVGEKVFGEDDPFEKLPIRENGGTDFDPVRTDILERRPTAAVIFTDLQARPMDPFPKGVRIPVIWVNVGDEALGVAEGEVIHFEEPVDEND
jgi:predicted metal-dependent peptidase